MPEVQDNLLKQGLIPTTSTPEELRRAHQVRPRALGEGDRRGEDYGRLTGSSIEVEQRELAFRRPLAGRGLQRRTHVGGIRHLLAVAAEGLREHWRSPHRRDRRADRTCCRAFAQPLRVYCARRRSSARSSRRCRTAPPGSAGHAPAQRRRSRPPGCNGRRRRRWSAPPAGRRCACFTPSASAQPDAEAAVARLEERARLRACRARFADRQAVRDGLVHHDRVRRQRFVQLVRHPAPCRIDLRRIGGAQRGASASRPACRTGSRNGASPDRAARASRSPGSR